jgi:hypothetical protein
LIFAIDSPDFSFVLNAFAHLGLPPLPALEAQDRFG